MNEANFNIYAYYFLWWQTFIHSAENPYLCLHCVTPPGKQVSISSKVSWRPGVTKLRGVSGPPWRGKLDVEGDLRTPVLVQTEPKCVCFSRQWISKLRSIHTVEYLFSHKKEWNSDTCYNLDKPWKYYVKWKQPDTKGHILHDFIEMKYTECVNPERQIPTLWRCQIPLNCSL